MAENVNPAIKVTDRMAAWKGEEMQIFFLGVLLGVLLGGTLCVTYLRQEVAAGINPKLRRVELQLDTIESQLNLAVMTRYAELGARSVGSSSTHQLPERNDD